MSLGDEDLSTRAQNGLLSKQEIAALVEEVASRPAEPATYRRLNAIGWTTRTDLVPIVAHFLEPTEDPMLGALALQILVNRWGLGESVADQVVLFADGVPWDEDDDLRLAALTSAGELARQEVQAHQMLAVLLRAVDPSEDFFVRDAGYSGLLARHGQFLE